MRTLPKLFMGAMLCATPLLGSAYPYYFCEGNGAPQKLENPNVRFTINESQFTGAEVSRLKNAVKVWSKNFIGETSLNVNPIASEVPEVTVANTICEGVANATGAPSTSSAWAFSLDACLELAFEELTDYNVIWRTGQTSGIPIVHLPPFEPHAIGWVFRTIVPPPGFSGDKYDAFEECLTADPEGEPKIDGIDVGQPYLSPGANVQLARSLIDGWYGHPGAGLGSVNQLELYEDVMRLTPTDMNIIATHEIGHVFGLAHPSTGSNTISMMRAKVDELVNYRNSSIFNSIRTAAPEPLDGKNIHNLYTATSPSLTAIATNQWQWDTAASLKVRPQSAYISYYSDTGLLAGEVTDWSYDVYSKFAVPVSLYNRGTTNKWVSGWVRFRKKSLLSNVGAPRETFGTPMPPRSTATIVRWIEKPYPSNNAPKGDYGIETKITAPSPPPSSLNPLKLFVKSLSGKTFSFN